MSKYSLFFFLFYFFAFSKEGFTPTRSADGLKAQAALDQILVLLLVVCVISCRHRVAVLSDPPTGELAAGSAVGGQLLSATPLDPTAHCAEATLPWIAASS